MKGSKLRHSRYIPEQLYLVVLAELWYIQVSLKSQLEFEQRINGFSPQQNELPAHIGSHSPSAWTVQNPVLPSALGFEHVLVCHGFMRCDGGGAGESLVDKGSFSQERDEGEEENNADHAVQSTVE